MLKNTVHIITTALCRVQFNVRLPYIPPSLLCRMRIQHVDMRFLHRCNAVKSGTVQINLVLSLRTLLCLSSKTLRTWSRKQYLPPKGQ